MTPTQKQHYIYLLHMTSGAKMLWHQSKRNKAQPMIPSAVLARLARFAAWAIVPCCDQLHVVVVSKKGRIGLLSHTTEEIHRWHNFLELGGTQAPPCLKWLKLMRFQPSAWISGNRRGPVAVASDFNPDSDSLPEDLCRLVAKAKVKRVNRGFKKGREEGTIT